jgi:secreted PhoX family phosphatase
MMEEEFSADEPVFNPSGNPALGELLERPGRRTLLKGALGSIALASGLTGCATAGSGPRLGFAAIAASGEDAVRVPAGYRADVVIAWGDPIGDPAGSPPFKFDASNTAEEQILQSGTHHDGMYFFPLPLGSQNSTHGLLVMNHEYPDHSSMFLDGSANWSLAKVRKSQHALGCSVQEVRLAGAKWEVVRPSKYARRVHANTAMRVGGPAAGNARMRSNSSASGREAYGTFNNCANGWTPWGTYLTCEENFSFHLKPPANPTALEERYELTPKVRASFNWGDMDPRFDMNVNRNEGNHFGWVVEFDPYDRNSVPVKRTALGRFSHEGAFPTLCKDGRLAIYSGDDRAFEYVYKFVTSRPWNPANRAANADLLDEGTLYVGRFNADGSGDWIELVHGRNGLTAANGFDSQAAVVIYARAAGDLVGATKMDRPEWIWRHPESGDVYVTLTNNTARGAKGREGATPSNPRAPNLYGHIVRWQEAGNDASATRFRWEVFQLGGDQYASPDGLTIDQRGVLWVQTDVSPAVLLKGDHEKFGNNQVLAVDPVTREVRRFMTGPRGCELTGGTFTPDGRTLFVNIQHPGEVPGPQRDPKNPGKLSNWPDYRPDGRPRSGTVAIRRADGGIVGT